MTDIETVENSIVDQAGTAAGVREAIPLGDPDLVKELMAGTVAVIFEGMTFEPPRLLGPVQQSGTWTWQVYLVAEAYRGPRSARRGTGGAYALIRTVILALLGFEPAGIGRAMYVVSVDEFPTEDQSRVYWLIRLAHDIEIEQV